MTPPVQKNSIRLAANYGQLGASFVVGLLLVRLLLGLGEEVYATIAVLAAGAGLARLFRDALQTGLVAFLGEAWHRPKANKPATEKSAFEASFLAALPVVLMAAAMGGLVFVLLNQLLSVLNVPEQLRRAAAFLIWCRAAQTIAATLATPWLTMILVREKMVLHNALILAERLIELTAALLITYWIGNDDPARAIRSFAAISCAACISLYTLTTVVMLIRERRFRPALRRPQWTDVRRIVSSFGWNASHTLAMNFHLRLNVVLVSSFFGIVSGMLFSIAGQATSYLRQLTMGLVGGVDALAARHHGHDQAQQLRDLAHRQMRHQALIVFPAAGALIIAAEPLLALWLGDRLENPQSSLPEIALLCRLLVAGVVARSLSETWIATLTGTDNARKFAPQVLAGAILNPLVILLAIQLLPEGIDRLAPALSFSTILVIVHLGWIPRVTARVLGVRVVELYRPCRIPATAVIVAALITFGVHQAGASAVTELIVFLACFAISQLALSAWSKPS